LFKISGYEYSLVEGLVAEIRVTSSTDEPVNISQEKRILENQQLVYRAMPEI
jgi:hypothetical protein